MSLLKQPCRTQASFALMKWSCQAAARWLARLRSSESKNAVHGSQKSSRQTGADRSTCKKAQKKQSNSTPLHPNTHTHTLTSTLRHHPPNRSGSRVGRKRGGKEAVAGILAFNLADSQLLLFLLGRVCLPGGHQGQETAVPPAPFFLPSTHLQSREAAAAPQLVPVSRSQKGSWGLFGNWYTCSSNGFAKLKFEVPSFCSGSQTPFCFKSSTFSPKRPSTMFLGSRNHTVIFKATLPAKCSCCPDRRNDLQWWVFTARIPTRCAFEPGQER